MRDSFRLTTIRGISIGLHWSIALIAGLFTLTLANNVFPVAAPGYTSGVYLIVALVVAVAFLASIVAHELGHAFVALNNGVGVKGITLFALGGVAKLESEPRSSGAAARIALAGPAVSVALGGAAVLGGIAFGMVGAPALAVSALTWFGVINVFMAVFNMLPALPLDGGRVLQAVLWKRKGDRLQATITAASVGRYVGWALVAFGLWQFAGGGGGLWTALIGWFIVSTAKAEGRRAIMEQRSPLWARPEEPMAGGSMPGSFTPGNPMPGSFRPGNPMGGGPRPGAAPTPPQRPVNVIDVDGHRVL